MCQQKIFLSWAAQRVTADLLGTGFGWQSKKRNLLFLALQSPPPPQGAMVSSNTRLLDHTTKHHFQ